jgi:hypothetical protein
MLIGTQARFLAEKFVKCHSTEITTGPKHILTPLGSYILYTITGHNIMAEVHRNTLLCTLAGSLLNVTPRLIQYCLLTKLYSYLISSE